MKECSKERGCDGKLALDGFANAVDFAERSKAKHGKDYGIYRCPHCGSKHLTTKLHKKDGYPPLLYTTERIEQ